MLGARVTTLVSFASVVLMSCVSGETTTDAMLDATDATADQGPIVYCRMEANEDCMACYENVGRCCYMDPTIGGHIQELVANCNGAPACRVCCNECASMTCETLRATHRCPY
jgi:hypothetical protein